MSFRTNVHPAFEKARALLFRFSNTKLTCSEMCTSCFKRRHLTKKREEEEEEAKKKTLALYINTTLSECYVYDLLLLWLCRLFYSTCHFFFYKSYYCFGQCCVCAFPASACCGVMMSAYHPGVLAGPVYQDGRFRLMENTKRARTFCCVFGLAWSSFPGSLASK